MSYTYRSTLHVRQADSIALYLFEHNIEHTLTVIDEDPPIEIIIEFKSSQDAAWYKISGFEERT